MISHTITEIYILEQVRCIAKKCQTIDIEWIPYAICKSHDKYSNK